MNTCGSTSPDKKPEWGLPRTVRVSGQELEVETDYRDILTIFAALMDPDLTDQEKSWVVLNRFYKEPEKIRDPDGALEAFAVFADCGAGGRQGPRLMDWEQDYPILAPAIDRVLGYSSRSCPYLHWWEYLGAFREVGDGLFAQVVAIRSQKARGKKLTPQQEAFARANPGLIRLDPRMTREEREWMEELMEPEEEKGENHGH